MSRGFRKFTMASHGLYLPETMRQRGELDNWPQCCRCGRAVEMVQFGEKNNKYCEIVAACSHGTGVRRRENYEAVRVSWPAGRMPTDKEYQKLIRDLRFFTGAGAVSSADGDPAS